MMQQPSLVNDANQGRPIRRFQLAALSRVTAQAVLDNGTIIHDGHSRVKVTTAGAVTGVILQAGVYDGQLLIIQNDSANSLTMAAVATSRVANGVTFVVPALSSSWLIWDQVLGTWSGRF